MYLDKKHTVLQNDNCLHIDITSLHNYYKVEILIEEHMNSKTRITYNAFVKTIDVLNEDVYLVSVVQKNYLINNQKPDLLLEQLAEKCRKPLENIVFYVSKSWDIIGIHNYNDIIEQWQVTKEKLEQEYTGEIFAKYINRHEQVLYNQQALMAKLKLDVFLNQYFCPVYERSFFNGISKYKEKVRFLTIDYEIDVVLQVVSNMTEKENIKLVKTIDGNEYKSWEMPIDLYVADYIFNKDLSINGIHGRFENHNRKFIFKIDQSKVIG